jgi:hypothetical protein
MAKKLIVDFLFDWVRDAQLRQKVLHKEKTELGNYGLDTDQIGALRKFVLPQIAKRMADELGVDLDDLRHAVYGPDSDGGTGALGAAAYDEGKTHIRRIHPAIVTQSAASAIMLCGHGFKSDPSKVTVEFLTGSPAAPTTVKGTVTGVSCDIDVWQRVAVNVTLNQTGEWAVRAHNDDDVDAGGNIVWSDPLGRLYVV